MAAEIGSVSAPLGAQIATAVAGKAQSQQKAEGQQAVQLIEGATAPQLANSGAVGTKLHFVA